MANQKKPIILVAAQPRSPQNLKTYLKECRHFTLPSDWDKVKVAKAVIPDLFIEQKISEIRKLVSQDKVLAAVSGGVDSSTCAVLTHRAVDSQLEMVFIDDGLMRKNEAQQVKEIFDRLGLNLEVVNAQDFFFAALVGKADPEEKRKAFRDAFYQTLALEAERRKAEVLVQGTIKADIIETVGGVKTQHNVLEQIGIDPRQYGFRVLEPLKDLFKDEVRQIAKKLGLPHEIFERMPFPGPGLALRVIGEVTPKRVAVVRQADKIVKEEIMPLRKDPEHPYQAFAVLMRDKSTGINVDGKRAFGNIIVVRVFDSKDAMTVTPTEIPQKKRVRIVKRITEELPSVVRVLFDETPKPPATIEFI